MIKPEIIGTVKSVGLSRVSLVLSGASTPPQRPWSSSPQYCLIHPVLSILHSAPEPTLPLLPLLFHFIPSLPPVEAGSGVLPRKQIFYITVRAVRELLRMSDNLNLS